MAKIETYKCDECGKIKDETNRWWIGQTSAMDGSGLFILPFAPASLKNADMHLCGESCVLKAVAGWMEKHNG